jgi:hypothetical protein
VIQNLTQKGEIVLELNTTGTEFLSEALTFNRRILAQNIDPIAMLSTHIAFNPVDVGQIRAALTRLGNSLKGNQSLESHIHQQYLTKCPDCAQEAVALWFAWDRDTQQPFYKSVRCINCGTERDGPADNSDALPRNLNPTTGLAYHVALERAAANNESIRTRIGELVSLYTERNLSALMDIIHRLPQASPSPDIRRILTAFIIEALDRGSSLIPYSNPDLRPKSLRPPRLFMEYNIWFLVENAMHKYASQSQLNPLPHAPATSLQSLISSDHGYILIANTLKSIVSRLPENEVKLVILHHEIPDVVYWALSSLWSTWLWKSERLPSAFRTYMGRRRIDQEWHQRDLRSTFEDLKPSLHNNAKILCPSSNNSISVLEDILFSARTSGYRVNAWLDTGTEGYRLMMVPGTDDDTDTPASPTEYYRQVLQERGEPCSLQQLNAAYLIAEPYADSEIIPAQFTSEFKLLGDDDLVWLQNERNVAKPLADRVEETILQLLQKKPEWTREQLEAEIYTLYTGPQTPEPELVNICINAYTITNLNNTLSLRPEDTPKTRRSELRESRNKIEQLGMQLGFSVARRLNSDIVWKEPQKVPYLFRFTSTALLTSHLLNAARMHTSERRCLVLPGGRASLVALKLRRDPRLQQAILRDHWVFIKFRHLRRMLAEIKHRGEIDFYLGLDPIVEMDSAQIPLPLE